MKSAKFNLYPKKSKHIFNIIGITCMLAIITLSIIIPHFSPYAYSDQNLNYSNIPPILKIINIHGDDYVYIHKELYLVQVSSSGEVLNAPNELHMNEKLKIYTYSINGKIVELDYSNIPEQNITPEHDKEYIQLRVNGKSVNLNNYKLVWNRSHILGTDQLGRDLLTRTFMGARVSLLVGFTASAVSLIIGIIYGGISGYKGGAVDQVMMGILNIINSIPLVLIVILFAVITKPGVASIILTIGVVYWIQMARQVRGEVMTLKQREFILAELVMGTPTRTIILKHIVPNAMETIISITAITIQNAIFTESFLSFIGIGIPAPFASWGTLVSDSLGSIRSEPYQLIIPALAIIFTMLALDLICDGISKRFNINMF